MRLSSILSDILTPRFLKFCGVGAANAAVDFCCYSLGIWTGLSPYTARILSWTAGCLFSYVVNRRWTFKAADKGLLPLMRFSVVNAVSLGLGLALLFLFKTIGCGDKTAFVLTLPFTTAANYLGYRFWSFKLVDGVVTPETNSHPRRSDGYE